MNPVPKDDLCTVIGCNESTNVPARRVRRIVFQFHVVCHHDVGQHEFQLACSEETSGANEIVRGVEPESEMTEPSPYHAYLPCPKGKYSVEVEAN